MSKPARIPTTCHECATKKAMRRAGGFTLLEMLVVVGIFLVLVTFAIPLTQRSLQVYRFNAAVTGLTGAIQSVRYQAIMKGYPFAITISQAAGTYQVSSKPSGAAIFTNVGLPVQLEPNATITLSNPTTTLQFNPNGSVQATAGTLAFSISDGTSNENITVSGVGNVTVSP